MSAPAAMLSLSPEQRRRDTIVLDGSNSPREEVYGHFFFVPPFRVLGDHWCEYCGHTYLTGVSACMCCCVLKFAAAVALAGPYHGASALLPSWRAARIEPGDASATSLVIAGTVNRTWSADPFPGELPPDVTNQVAVGLMVRTLLPLDPSYHCAAHLIENNAG